MGLIELGGDGGEDDFRWLGKFFPSVFTVDIDFLFAGTHFEFDASDDVYFLGYDRIGRDGGASARSVFVGVHNYRETTGLFWGWGVTEEVAGKFSVIFTKTFFWGVVKFFGFGVRGLGGEEDWGGAFPLEEGPV